MTKVLDRLPVSPRERIAFLRDERVHFKGAEIIVWIGLGVKRAMMAWRPGIASFPAILDTGYTHNLSIQEQHLVRWTGIRPELLQLLGHVRQAGKRIPLHAANVWLHANRPGTHELDADRPPLLLELPRGIAVHRDAEDYPRLPLLGMRALLSNRLHLAIDGERQSVNLRTPDWRTRLMRWLL